jgi:hypothetical protein
MTILSLIIVAVFVFAILGIAALALLELTPLAHRTNPYRDPTTGRRRFDSPHLEAWGEFERRRHDDLS